MLKNKIIIHICGPANFENTIFFSNFMRYSNHQIKIIDLKKELTKFIIKNYSEKKDHWIEYSLNPSKYKNLQNKVQKYLNILISKTNKKIIIIYGHNYEPFIEKYFYNLYSKYNFYIESSTIKSLINKYSNIRFYFSIETIKVLLDFFPSLIENTIVNYFLAKKYKEKKYVFISENNIDKILIKIMQKKFKI